MKASLARARSSRSSAQPSARRADSAIVPSSSRSANTASARSNRRPQQPQQPQQPKQQQQQQQQQQHEEHKSLEPDPRVASARARLRTTRAQLVGALQRVQDGAKTDYASNDEMLLRVFRSMDIAATGKLTLAQLEEAVGPMHLGLTTTGGGGSGGGGGGGATAGEGVLERGRMLQAAEEVRRLAQQRRGNSGAAAADGDESGSGKQLLDYVALCKLLRLNHGVGTHSDAVACGNLSKRYYDPFHKQQQGHYASSAAAAAASASARSSIYSSRSAAAAAASSSSARGASASARGGGGAEGGGEGEGEGGEGPEDEWVMSHRGPLTSARGFLTGPAAAAASDARHREQQQQQRQQRQRAPLGELQQQQQQQHATNATVDSASASAAKRLARLERKRAQQREHEAAHAAARAAESQRAGDRAAGRLEACALLGAGARRGAAAREEKAFARRVGPQRGLNEEQQGKVFNPTAGNGLLAARRSGRGGGMGALLSGRSCSSAQGRCYEKRNASSVNLDHFSHH
jgi:hypothetical protein